MKHNFRELKIWKDAMVIAEESYKMTKALPEIEKYGLMSQINRCSISIPSNIAEGSGRESDKDFARFLGIALGSSFELETQLLLIDRIYPSIHIESLLKILKRNQNYIYRFKKTLSQ